MVVASLKVDGSLADVTYGFSQVTLAGYQFVSTGLNGGLATRLGKGVARVVEVPRGVWGCAPPSRELLRHRSWEVAPLLLGMLIAKGDTGLIITEVEAYGGPDDEASHAYRGVSRRNMSMFGDGGTLYVYLSYGIHRCINVVSGCAGNGQAVLIRSGIMVVRPRKILDPQIPKSEVVPGPGRVGRIMDAQLGDDGVDLLDAGSWRLLDSSEVVLTERFVIERSTRIGISRAREFEWRFAMAERSTDDRTRMVTDASSRPGIQQSPGST